MQPQLSELELWSAGAPGVSLLFRTAQTAPKYSKVIMYTGAPERKKAGYANFKKGSFYMTATFLNLKGTFLQI